MGNDSDRVGAALAAFLSAARSLADACLDERGELGGGLCDLIAGAMAGGRPHTQRDGERPIGAGKAKYLRVWKAAYAAQEKDVWSEGRARLMTPEAWRRLTETVPVPRVVKRKAASAEPTPAPMSSIDARRARLGIVHVERA